MPDARQAWQVLEAMRKLPDDPYGFAGWGERSEPFADFAMLRYPIYLPIVKEMAERGDARGLQAIGAMAFPEATAALIDPIFWEVFCHAEEYPMFANLIIGVLWCAQGDGSPHPPACQKHAIHWSFCYAYSRCAGAGTYA